MEYRITTICIAFRRLPLTVQTSLTLKLNSANPGCARARVSLRLALVG